MVSLSESETAMRDHYIKQLQAVHDDLLRMGSRVEHQLADAIKALDRLDIVLAREVVARDREIDAARNAIDERVFELIAMQQPVATDLRSLLAAVAIAGELERAADYAKGIAKKVERSLHTPAIIEAPIELHRLGTLVQNMLHTCLDAFVQLDVALARSLGERDHEIDALEDRVVEMLKDIACRDPNKLDCALLLIDTAHVLERLADRTTNIAERVIFIATAKAEEINP
ncbi:phosphate signaling complex protein PhoU [Roseiflexus castenholzii]|nr:phosphate signaling complex protein PhoU [Roseiflexus castenholzii]